MLIVPYPVIELCELRLMTDVHLLTLLINLLNMLAHFMDRNKRVELNENQNLRCLNLLNSMKLAFFLNVYFIRECGFFFIFFVFYPNQ